MKMYGYGRVAGESARSGSISKKDRLLMMHVAKKKKKRAERWAAIDWQKIKRKLKKKGLL